MAAHLTSEEFWSLMGKDATLATAHGVSDVHLGFDHELMQLRSHVLLMDGLTIVRGSNRATRDLMLDGEQHDPQVALQVGLRGTASTRLEGLREPLRNAGGDSQMIFTLPGRYEVTLGAGTTNEVFRVNLTPAYFTSLADRYPELADGVLSQVTAGTPVQLGDRRIGPLARLLELVDDVTNSACFGSLRRSFIESKIIELLVRYVGAARDQNGGRPTPRDIDRMVEARDRLLSRIADPPTAAELAHSVGTNEFTLKRDFKAVFQRSVYAFVLERRLEHAYALLVETDRPIKDIAEQSGYAHLSHFGAAFRKRYGVPPSRVRKRRSS